MKIAKSVATLATAAILCLAADAGGAALAAQEAGRYVVAPAGNEARYLVREQLARINFPSDAVGTTTGVEGAITVDGAGRIGAGSGFTIDLASLASDSDRRDNYVRRNTLQTDEHPSAVFVPTAFSGLAFPLQAGEAAFRITGDLTIRGVTRPVTWDVTARTAGDGITGTARTSFTFEDFSLDKPRVASVLSVADEIRLEYEFSLVRER
ncbi:MAG TPA: YceI family protein [Longimicrobiales bacterium]|nr:YceI family protein [Longimicrobiales bacterium]